MLIKNNSIVSSPNMKQNANSKSITHFMQGEGEGGHVF